MAHQPTLTAQIAIKNPLTCDIIAQVPNSTPEDVFQAVARARQAQPTWETRGDRGRARLLRLWADALWSRRDDLVDLIRSETGKTEAGALAEIMVLDNIMAYYAYHAPLILKSKTRRGLVPLTHTARLHYRPYGVVGFITPWNYPYLNGLQDAVAALVAGNTVILKPSEIAPLTVCFAVETAHRAGIPRDAIQAITGDGSTGAALVDGVDCISFTGSTETGRKVAVRAAQRLIPYTLELGGKDPLIVLDDVDVDQAAITVLQGALENAGQVCVSVERIYVLDTIYDPFMERLLHHANRLKIGPEPGLDVHVGSMTNTTELERCEAHIADAKNKGARVIFGGQRRPDLGPLFFEPTILVDVDHTMALMNEESFGPLVPVMHVSGADEAIRLANDSSYGLSSAILARDVRRAEQIAQRIVAGDTSINRAQLTFATPSLPTGGRKNSGIGRRNGPEGLLRFVAPHAITVDRQWFVNRQLHVLDPVLFGLLQVGRVLRRWFPFI